MGLKISWYSKFSSSSLKSLPASVNFSPYFDRKLHFEMLGEITVWDPVASLRPPSSEGIVILWGGGKMKISGETFRFSFLEHNFTARKVTSSIFGDISLCSGENTSFTSVSGWWMFEDDSSSIWGDISFSMSSSESTSFNSLPGGTTFEESSTQFEEGSFTSGEWSLISVEGSFTLAIFIDKSAIPSNMSEIWQLNALVLLGPSPLFDLIFQLLESSFICFLFRFTEDSCLFMFERLTRKRLYASDESTRMN